MRTTVAELAAAMKTLGEARFVRTWGADFLVADPGSAFNIPVGPQETMRVDRSAFLASSRGEYHPSTPVFQLRRRPDSVYSFVSVGRTDNCDISLPDDTVSKLHALLREKGRGWVLQDADSANGTFRGEFPVPGRSAGEPVTIAPGDALRFGSIKLHYVDVPRLKALIDQLNAPGE